MGTEISSKTQQELLKQSQVHHHHHHQSSLSSPESSPQHGWPMVPVLQTLTVLSDGEEELMEQKMGIEPSNVNGVYTPNTPSIKLEFNSCSPPYNLSLNQTSPNQSGGQKRKVGRPITSTKTMNRSFPAVAEIREKLLAGECYVRPRASNSSSDVWALFMEVAYNDTHFFTGIVQCKTCKFLTRYHGQITGTSHMRRHACFSLMFPNSAPVRKSKAAVAAAAAAAAAANALANGGGGGKSLLNGANVNSSMNINMDADSTTPKAIMKQLKKENGQPLLLNGNGGVGALSTGMTRIVPIHPAIQQHLNSLNGGGGAANSPPNSVTIHPPLPKKKFRNSGYVPMLNERSIMASNSSSLSVSPVASLLNGGSGQTLNISQQQQQQQQQHQQQHGLHQNGNAHASSPPRSSSSSASSPLPVSPNMFTPSAANSFNSNNTRVNNSKQDLKEKLIQFCCNELVPLSITNSESFRSVLQSHLRVCATQLQQQLQSQNASLMNAVTMTSSFLAHLSHQLPDENQLRSSLELIHRQCRDRLKADLHRALVCNPGNALICDSDQDACVISVYYVDAEWKLIEAVLSASSVVLDINRFVSNTLETYQLTERERFNKFTFVSHGGQFGNVSLCLLSMGHIVDQVVNEAMANYEEESKSLTNLFNTCRLLANKLKLNMPAVSSVSSEWLVKHDLLKVVRKNREMIQEDDDLAAIVDFDLIGQLIDLFESFRTASFELRKCSKHPTLCHVLLYYHKLKKVLSTAFPTPSTTASLVTEKKATTFSSSSSPCSSTDPKPLKLVKERVASSSIDSELSDSDKEREIDEEEEKMTKKKLIKASDDEGEMLIASREYEENDDEEDDDDDEKENILKVSVEKLKKCLLDSLHEHYKVESLHRVATFLWPNFRFLKMLPSNEQKEVHNEVRRLLHAHCHSVVISNAAIGKKANNPSSDASSVDSKSRSEFDEWEVDQVEQDDMDEVDKYLSMQLSSCSEVNVLQWWRQHSNDFPKISHLAKWILAIPASVTSRERYNFANRPHIDDQTLFLHCNLQNEKFAFPTLRKATKPKMAKATKISSSSSIPSNSSSSMITQ